MSGFLLILSPAKTMQFAGPVNALHACTQPKFAKQATELAAELKTKKVGALKGLLGGLSENLASLNHDRYQAFAAAPGTAPVDGKLRPSAFAYDGPAFKGLGIDGLDKTAQGYLQRHLRILTGLYGAVRPMDLIQPYRLCMGTKLGIAATNTKDLYGYWKARGLPGDVAAEFATPSGDCVVVNVASNEYSAVLPRTELPKGFTWVDCVFKDSGRILSVFAKRARGLMCRYCAENDVRSIAGLKGFNLEGYRFSAGESTDTTLVFGRAKPEPKPKPKPKAMPKPKAKCTKPVTIKSEPGATLVPAKKRGQPARKRAVKAEPEDDSVATAGPANPAKRSSKRTRRT